MPENPFHILRGLSTTTRESRQVHQKGMIKILFMCFWGFISPFLGLGLIINLQNLYRLNLMIIHLLLLISFRTQFMEYTFPNY